eukprot:jgi/Bigna1/80835/fgenesh1_pg.74_\
MGHCHSEAERHQSFDQIIQTNNNNQSHKLETGDHAPIGGLDGEGRNDNYDPQTVQQQQTDMIKKVRGERLIVSKTERENESNQCRRQPQQLFHRNNHSNPEGSSKDGSSGSSSSKALLKIGGCNTSGNTNQAISTATRNLEPAAAYVPQQINGDTKLLLIDTAKQKQQQEKRGGGNCSSVAAHAKPTSNSKMILTSADLNSDVTVVTYISCAIFKVPLRRKNGRKPPTLDLHLSNLPQPIVGCEMTPIYTHGGTCQRPDIVRWFKRLCAEKEGGGGGEWEFVGTGFTYTPNEYDLHHQLKIEFIVNGKCYQHPNPLMNANGTKQQQLLVKGAAVYESWKILSWNTLADQARDAWEKKCKKHQLMWAYRFLNLLTHIRRQDADVLCLQEIDKNHLTNWWTHHLGFNYHSKYAGSNYGCALFFKKDKFIGVQDHLICFESEIIDLMDADIKKLCISKPELKDEIQDSYNKLMIKRTCIVYELRPLAKPAVVTTTTTTNTSTANEDDTATTATAAAKEQSLLQERRNDCSSSSSNSQHLYHHHQQQQQQRADGKGARGGGYKRENNIFVVNCHLYRSDKKKEPFIRLMQIHVLIKALQRITKDVRNPKIIVAGDFNSTPTSCVYDYMQEGKVNITHRDLEDCLLLKELMPAMEHPFTFRSSYREVLNREEDYCRHSEVW